MREGNREEFLKVFTDYEDLFKKNDNYNLLIRLRQNSFIYRFMNKSNASYSKISIRDVMHKLGLQSVTEAESIVTKAIRDKVIDAVIDKESGILITKEETDVYSSKHPQTQLDKRIRFCMEIYNDSVKALEYPKKDKPKEIKEYVQDDAELVETLLEDFDDL